MSGSKVSSDRIAVAMSGGLDSSVTAWLLAEEGRDVVGLSMLLWDASNDPVAPKNGRCCGALDLSDARRVAEQCGIPHFTLEMEEDFRQHVVEPFVDDYLQGKTPVPCTQCNTWIKFDLFLERAQRLGASKIATGHYARIVEGPDGFELHKSRNEEKDQSYYLFELTQEQLSRSSFPLGERSKEDVREMAREAGLVVAEKGESMEICFVSSGIQEFVERQVRQHPERFAQAPDPVPSEMVTEDGKTLGEGDPYYRYTVGQRRGLGVSNGERLYVIGVQPDQNQVVVGGREKLSAPGLIGERVHWIGMAPQETLEATVRIRSRHSGVRSKLTPLADGTLRVEFDEPQFGVTPGQAAVFYEGTRVLGGCWIEQALSSEAFAQEELAKAEAAECEADSGTERQSVSSPPLTVQS